MYEVKDSLDTAVIWYDKNDKKCSLSYAQLCQAIHQRSHYFLKDLKLKKGDVVGVLAPRGPEYLINMLALWKIGAVYLPLSDAWKEKDAIRNRLQSSKACYLLTVKETHQRYPEECKDINICHTDQIPAETSSHFHDLTFIDVSPHSPAYIFSSSGTTGTPKLIQLPHVGIRDRIDDHIHYMEIGSGDGVLGFIDFGFDASVVEMLIAVFSGNTLFIVPQEVRNQSYQLLPDFIQKHESKIHVGILLPSVLKGLKPEHCPGLNKIVTMGEACLLKQLKEDKWFDHAKIYNGYGPTETTFGATLTLLHKKDTEASIHRPMKGITLYLRESFSIIFVPENETEYEKEENIFYLKFSETEKQWQYTIKYSLDTTQKQDKLSRDLNERIKKAKNGDKKEEAILLSQLIQKTVGYPRIIAQFEQNQKHHQNKKPICGEIVIAGSGIGTYLNLDEKVKEKFRTAEQAEKEGFNIKGSGTLPCLFMSGDIAEYNGKKLIYKNRNDNQIKRYGQLVTIDGLCRNFYECLKNIHTDSRQAQLSC